MKKKNIWEGTSINKRMDLYMDRLAKFYPKNGKNIEIGCGEGYFMERLREKGVNSLGIETDDSERKRAIDRGFKVLNHDANTRLPFQDSSFDTITMISIFEHIKNKKTLVSEIRRILKKGGLCIIQIPNPYFPLDLHYQLPFWGYLPKRLSEIYVSLLVPKDYSIYYYVSKTTPLDVRKYFKDLELIYFKKNNFNKKDVPTRFQKYYSIYHLLRLDSLLPMGFIMVYKKR